MRFSSLPVRETSAYARFGSKSCDSTPFQYVSCPEGIDAQADAHYASGEHAGITGDKYIRVTVILASVLFLVGISSHFPLRGVRIGLVMVGAALLLFAAVQILQLPGPPA